MGVLKSLIIMTVMGSAITILLLVLEFITKNHFSAKWHYNTKKIAMVFFVIPIMLLYSNFEFNGNSNDEIINSSNKVNIIEDNKSDYDSESIVNNNVSNTVIEESNKGSNGDLNEYKYIKREVSRDYIRVVLGVWISGMALLIIWYSYSYIRFLRSIKKCSEVIEENSLIIPKEIIDDSNLREILYHELTHVKRRDLFLKFIMLLISIIHWFNPFVYILRRQLDCWCELSCDEIITLKMNYDERKGYGQAIIRVVENLVNKGFKEESIFISTFGSNKKNIERRLKMVLKSKKMKKITAIISVAIIIAVVVISVVVGRFTSEKSRGIITKESNKGNLKEISQEVVSKDNKSDLQKVDNDIEKIDNNSSDSGTVNGNEIANESEFNTNSNDIEEEINDNSGNILYVNSNYGFSLEIPKSWEGKYEIRDTGDYSDGAYVFIKNDLLNQELDYGEDKNYGLLFMIKLAEKKEDGTYCTPMEQFIDSINGMPSEVVIHGNTFYPGTTLDVPIRNEDESREVLQMFFAMSKEAQDVAKTLKEY